MRLLLHWRLFALQLISVSAFSQRSNNEVDRITSQYAKASFKEFREFLSLPNVASNPADIEKNVQWCEDAFAKRGFSTQRLTTETLPLLLAERKVKNTRPKKNYRTILIYLQIDGQPVDPPRWSQESPWKATLKEQDADGNWNIIPYNRLQGEINPEWRIFARSASDAKGPVVTFLAALDALEKLKDEPDYHIKVIMDFEEEIGSPQLPKAVEKFRQQLQADWLVIYDGPRHTSNQPTLLFGARGICEITITTFGARVPLHSGNYGNYAPNPALRLSQLLASMKQEDGRVIIPGFYDGVKLTDEDLEVLSLVPDNEEEIKKNLGIAEAEKVGKTFQEALQYPTLNIRGLNSLYTGKESRTLIPATATAEIDIRLVSSSDPVRLIELVRRHVEAQGYYIVKEKPTEEERLKYPKIASFESKVSYSAFQTPFDSECGQWLSRTLVKAFGREPIKIRTAGGSIPISPFVITLGIPAVVVPTVNADNNQHADDENIRVGNYMDAVKTFLYILMEGTK